MSKSEFESAITAEIENWVACMCTGAQKNNPFEIGSEQWEVFEVAWLRSFEDEDFESSDGPEYIQSLADSTWLGGMLDGNCDWQEPT